jgi:hypothetical protein
MRFSIVVSRVAVAGALALLAGCHTAAQLANCPPANVLASTAQRTTFKKGLERDLAGEVYTVEITGVRAVCSFDKDEGTTDNDIEIAFRARRPPSGDEANYTVPYYVATLLDGNQVLEKQILATSFYFAPGQAETTFTADVSSKVIHLANGKKPYEYGLLVGIQLTREEMDYSNSRGRYAP